MFNCAVNSGEARALRSERGGFNPEAKRAPTARREGGEPPSWRASEQEERPLDIKCGREAGVQRLGRSESGEEGIKRVCQRIHVTYENWSCQSVMSMRSAGRVNYRIMETEKLIRVERQIAVSQ